MAKEKKDIDAGFKDEVYSRLVISRKRQSGLFICIGCVFVVITTFLFAELQHNRPWLEYVIPVSLVGTILMLYPSTEAWFYRPWQKSTRKIEQHYLS